jgi:hypothetical protein
MIYHFSLHAIGLVAGGVLVLLSLLALFLPVGGFLSRFPRSRSAGAILLTVDLVWSFWLLATMEMGEFSRFRLPLLIALPVGFFLVLFFVDEFLAVRALGILCLLAAEPLLDAAFLQPQSTRLLVTVLAYAMIIKGLFWVTMPYLLRDQINWGLKHLGRWRILSGLWLLFGVALLVCAFVAY